MIEERRKTFMVRLEIVEKPCVSRYVNCRYVDVYELRFSFVIPSVVCLG